MGTAFAYILAIVAFVIVLNFVMLMFRLRRDRYQKPSREAIEEEKAVVLRDKEIRRRLEREENEALERVILRNKTLELYEEVRRRAAAREKEALKGNAPEAADLEPAKEAPNSEATPQEPSNDEHGLWTGDWGHGSGFKN